MVGVNARSGKNSKAVREFKAAGNKAMQAGAFQKAMRLYTKALEIDAGNAILYSNRSAAFFNTRQFSESLEDAESAILCDANWWKAYKRKGLALIHMQRYEEAIQALEEGLKIVGKNAEMEKNLEFARACQEQAQNLYILPEPHMMQRLESVPVFIVTDNVGQPFFVTYDDGQQVCTFYFDQQDAISTLDWIKAENPDLGDTARVIHITLHQAFNLAQETQKQYYEETTRAAAEEDLRAAAEAEAKRKAKKDGGAGDTVVVDVDGDDDEQENEELKEETEDGIQTEPESTPERGNASGGEGDDQGKTEGSVDTTGSNGAVNVPLEQANNVAANDDEKQNGFGNKEVENKGGAKDDEGCEEGCCGEVESKAAESKAAESKAAESKAAESKAAESKAAEIKAAESKEEESECKAGCCGEGESKEAGYTEVLSKDAGCKETCCKEDDGVIDENAPLSFQFRPELRQVQVAVELLNKHPNPPVRPILRDPPSVRKAKAAAKAAAAETEADAKKEPKADAENTGSKNDGGAKKKEGSSADTEESKTKATSGNTDDDEEDIELTVDNFNGIPIFQAKGLTLLQKNKQLIPLFFSKWDLEDAWKQLKQSNAADVPSECEIEVGTLEDVLRRMSESKTDEFQSVFFVPSRESMKAINVKFPLDDLAPSNAVAKLGGGRTGMRKAGFSKAKQIAARGGTKEEIRAAIREDLEKHRERQRMAEIIAQIEQAGKSGTVGTGARTAPASGSTGGSSTTSGVNGKTRKV